MKKPLGDRSTLDTEEKRISTLYIPYDPFSPVMRKEMGTGETGSYDNRE